MENKGTKSGTNNINPEEVTKIIEKEINKYEKEKFPNGIIINVEDYDNELEPEIIRKLMDSKNPKKTYKNFLWNSFINDYDETKRIKCIR